VADNHSKPVTGKYWIVQEMCPLLKRVKIFKNIIKNNDDDDDDCGGNHVDDDDNPGEL
jgi:hypothetical protein